MMNNELMAKVENIVRNEVLVCQSSLVEMLLQQEIVSYDDIKNMYIDNSEEIEENQEEKENIELSDEYMELDSKYMNDTLSDIEEERHNELNKQIETLENKIQELESEQEEPQEVFEWWAVSNWLASQLEEQGEPILKNEYGTWWGRTCTGQSISMDYVIQEIAK